MSSLGEVARAVSILLLWRGKGASQGARVKLNKSLTASWSTIVTHIPPEQYCATPQRACEDPGLSPTVKYRYMSLLTLVWRLELQFGLWAANPVLAQG